MVRTCVAGVLLIAGVKLGAMVLGIMVSLWLSALLAPQAPERVATAEAFADQPAPNPQ